MKPYFNQLRPYLEKVFPEFITTGQANVDLREVIPHCDQLNQVAECYNEQQQRLQFVPQDASLAWPEMSYEQRIYEYGLIATRDDNWHDFFNALSWLSFPRLKSILNAIHWHELMHQQDSVRSARRDALTLFDECGVIIMSEDKSLLNAIIRHDWSFVFCDNRAAWLYGDIQMITFGHAMFEKYLTPYIGMTAKALLIQGTASISMTQLDEQLSRSIANQQCLLSSQALAPFPVLGVPQWYTKQDAAFYGNQHYFRPTTTKSRPIIKLGAINDTSNHLP